MGCSNTKQKPVVKVNRQQREMLEENARKMKEDTDKGKEKIDNKERLENSDKSFDAKKNNTKFNILIQSNRNKDSRDKFTYLKEKLEKKYTNAAIEHEMVEGISDETFDVFFDGDKVFCEELDGDIRKNFKKFSKQLNKLVS